MWVAVVSSLPMGTAAWPCRPGVRLSETPVAFAGAGRASTETGIAFAGENWVFLARFSLALVLPVSMGVVHGRALVLVVSPSPPQCVLSAKKFALRWRRWGLAKQQANAPSNISDHAPLA